MNRLSIFFVVGCLGLFCSDTSADDPTIKSEKSLDDALLDGLDDDLLDGLDDPPPAESSDDPEPSEPSGIDRDLLDQLGEGEDIEPGKQTDPLTRIANRMRTAEQLIAGRDTSEKTQQLQREILLDLTALIEMQKQQAAQSAERPRRPQTGSADQEPGSSPGPERSTPRLDKPEVVKQELESQQDLVKKTWGDLPKRYIDQMLNSNVESFLPEYARLIEEYFIRLAEENASR